MEIVPNCMFLIDWQCSCAVFFESYVSNLSNSPDLMLTIKLVIFDSTSALVSVSCFLKTSFLSVKHSDSL